MRKKEKREREGKRERERQRKKETEKERVYDDTASPSVSNPVKIGQHGLLRIRAQFIFYCC